MVYLRRQVPRLYRSFQYCRHRGSTAGTACREGEGRSGHEVKASGGPQILKRDAAATAPATNAHSHLRLRSSTVASAARPPAATAAAPGGSSTPKPSGTLSPAAASAACEAGEEGVGAL